MGASYLGAECQCDLQTKRTDRVLDLHLSSAHPVTTILARLVSIPEKRGLSVQCPVG